jgi:NADH-quinone oxidoreductase subunit J
MTLTFTILGILTVGAAIAAMTLRNLVHCALALAITFAGLAGLYLRLDAQFVGFAQILVYVGAVAILIVFAILLTRGGGPPQESVLSPGWLAGIGIAAVVFGLLTDVMLSSKALLNRGITSTTPPAATVRQIGDQLMTRYVLPLEIIGLLLTAALIGAVIIALYEKEAK